MKPTLPLWETLEAGAVRDHGVFGLQEVARRSPRTGRPGRYQILHVPDWTNVVALTPERRLVLVEQYRHGLDTLTWEIPGGAVDPGEDAAAAAERELLEETGYRGAAPELLGTVHPNPAIQTNTCTTWLVADAVPTAEPVPDPGEHIAVHTVARGDVPELLRSGVITHSLVVAALYWLELHERGGASKSRVR